MITVWNSSITVSKPARLTFYARPLPSAHGSCSMVTSMPAPVWTAAPMSMSKSSRMASPAPEVIHRRHLLERLQAEGAVFSCSMCGVNQGCSAAHSARSSQLQEDRGRIRSAVFQHHTCRAAQLIACRRAAWPKAGTAVNGDRTALLYTRCLANRMTSHKKCIVMHGAIWCWHGRVGKAAAAETCQH